MAERVEVLVDGRDIGGARVLDRTAGRIGRLTSLGRRAGGVFGRIGGAVAAPFRMGAAAMGKLLSLQSLIITGAGAIGARALFAPSIDIETWETQLAVLLGGTDAAKAKIDELRKFAVRTPFQLEGLVTAVGLLQNFTNGALTTEAGLTLVGDAAGATTGNLTATAEWVGRLYSQLKNKSPFIDSVTALQRLRVLSGEARPMLQRMVDEGADFGEIWGYVEGQLKRFEGGMATLAATTEGKFSTLKDSIRDTFADISGPLLPQLKSVLDGILAGLDQLRGSGATKGIGEGLSAAVGPVLSGLSDIPFAIQQRKTIAQGFADNARINLARAAEPIAGAAAPRPTDIVPGAQLMRIIPQIASALFRGKGIEIQGDVNVNADDGEQFADSLQRPVAPSQL